MDDEQGAFPAQRARFALRAQRCDGPGLCPGHALLLAYTVGLLATGATGVLALGWGAGVATLLVLVLAPWRGGVPGPRGRRFGAAKACPLTEPWPRGVRPCVRSPDVERGCES